MPVNAGNDAVEAIEIGLIKPIHQRSSLVSGANSFSETTPA
jgi:hypothetical protein